MKKILFLSLALMYSLGQAHAEPIRFVDDITNFLGLSTQSKKVDFEAVLLAAVGEQHCCPLTITPVSKSDKRTQVAFPGGTSIQMTPGGTITVTRDGSPIAERKFREKVEAEFNTVNESSHDTLARGGYVKCGEPDIHDPEISTKCIQNLVKAINNVRHGKR